MTKTSRTAVNNSRAYRNADVINAIRNSNLSMREEIPAADGTLENVIKIGEIIEGNPAFLQHFSGLLRQIAQVRVSNREFDQFYSSFIKGDLPFGGTVEEAFVNIARARDFAPAKANAREFARIRPDIRAKFHTLNWQAQYQVTVDRLDIQKAFRNDTGVVDLVDRIVASIQSGENVDHKFLTEYLIKRSILNGSMKAVTTDATDLTDLSKASRSTALRFSMPSREFNAEHVYTHTPADSIYLVMDADTYAEYDVDVLANAFNMDKATLTGHTIVLDRWDEFDFDRFTDVNDAHKQLEPFTAEETEKLSKVKAVMVDMEAFQIYNLNHIMSDVFSASGLHTNYFLTVERIYSWSPFSNAVAFVAKDFDAADSDTVDVTVEGVSDSGQVRAYELGFSVPVGKDASIRGIWSADSEAVSALVRGSEVIVAKDSKGTSKPVPVTLVNGKGTKYSFTLPAAAKTGDKISAAKAGA